MPLLVVFGLVLFGAWASLQLMPSTPHRARAANSRVDLDAKVDFNGTQFTILNTGNVTWANVRCRINPSGLQGRGYEYEFPILKPGEQTAIAAATFATPDGTRFNPIRTKPQEFIMTADVDGKSGVYAGGWK